LDHRRSDRLTRHIPIGVWIIGVFLKVFFGVRVIGAASFQSARSSVGLDSYGLLIEFAPLLSELLQFLAHHKHVVEDHTVGYQVIELDNFALFLPTRVSGHNHRY
jgi:hypothetical protein